jgi:hypothetical protein
VLKAAQPPLPCSLEATEGLIMDGAALAAGLDFSLPTGRVAGTDTALRRDVYCAAKPRGQP